MILRINNLYVSANIKSVVSCFGFNKMFTGGSISFERLVLSPPSCRECCRTTASSCPFLTEFATHFKNNKTCFSGYNMDEFPQMKSVNSQQAEQINRSLRSLATVLAHLRWETYLKVLELYFVHRNLRVKKI